jgi:hypothetical protein
VHQRYVRHSHYDDTVATESEGLIRSRRDAGRERCSIWRLQFGFLAGEGVAEVVDHHRKYSTSHNVSLLRLVNQLLHVRDLKPMHQFLRLGDYVRFAVCVEDSLDV